MAESIGFVVGNDCVGGSVFVTSGLHVTNGVFVAVGLFALDGVVNGFNPLAGAQLDKIASTSS